MGSAVAGPGDVMGKPQWLIDKESDKRDIPRNFDMCSDCVHYGLPVKFTYHKDGKKIPVFACSLHRGCLNTMYSIGCGDFEMRQMV